LVHQNLIASTYRLTYKIVLFTRQKMTDFQNSENHFIYLLLRLSTVSYGQEARRLVCTKRYEDPPQYGRLG
jgi:hypothetical protein